MIDKQSTTNGSTNLAMAITCPKCGAENTDEARFCRICGVQLGAEGFHEAPTRNFEQGKTPSPTPAQEVSPFATYGADGSAILPPRDPRMYVPPSVVQLPGAMMGYQHGTAPAGPIPTNPLQTGPVRKSKVGRVLAIVAGIFALILACLIGLGIWVASNIKVNNEPVVGGAGPAVAEKDRSAPASPAVSMDDWVYDGATVDIRSEGSAFGMEGGLLKMTTEDDVETVGDFYRDLLADATQKQEIREPDKLVFISDGTVVVVEPSEDTEGMTSINVVFGNMAGIPGAKGGKPGMIPPIPVEPVVAPPEAPAPPTTSDGKAKPGTTAPKAEATAPPAKPAKP
ncbi:MAG: zinc ribbon domain-containing protein [Blastocatellia bacterium]|nr:zinc ribbon domain-containing protein [Blastocatellia bacterium]